MRDEPQSALGRPAARSRGADKPAVGGCEAAVQAAAAAAPYRSALRFPRTRRGVRARVRAILPRRPGTEGPGKGGGRLEAGARRDTAPGQSRPPRAGGAGWARWRCGGGPSFRPQAGGEGCPRVALGTPGTAAARTPWSPAAGPRRDVLSSCVRCPGCGILSLGVGLQSCPGDGMWSVSSSLWWGRLVAGAAGGRVAHANLRVS
ncbi:uncharacterized protein [Symphalangus syndactylus]|uniref:uncharacterized protein n=1 Tax=Symphalangus syndactylus TaxID=9590 RepID=UPI003007D210